MKFLVRYQRKVVSHICYEVDAYDASEAIKKADRVEGGNNFYGKSSEPVFDPSVKDITDYSDNKSTHTVSMSVNQMEDALVS